MSVERKQGFEFVYGSRRGSWFSLKKFKTAQEAEDAGINSMKEHVLNGYAVIEDYGVFRKGWTSEFDDFGIIKQTTSTELVTVIRKEHTDQVIWETEIYKRISNMNPTTDSFDQMKFWMKNLLNRKKLSKDEYDWLYDLLLEKMQIRKIVSGTFTEDDYVTVNIDGCIITRKVRWSGKAKDLYVVKDNKKYFFCEFWDKNDETNI